MLALLLPLILLFGAAMLLLRLAATKAAIALALNHVGIRAGRVKVTWSKGVLTLKLAGVELDGTFLGLLNRLFNGRLALELQAASLQRLTLRVELLQVNGT